MITNVVVGNAIGWFDLHSGVPNTPASAWRKARNKWLRAQGVCGIIKEGKQSRSIPPWWTDGTKFWCNDEIDEQIFINKWSNP